MKKKNILIKDLEVSKTSLSNDPKSTKTSRSEVSEVSDQPPLPEGWKWVRLGDVAELIRGVNYKKEEASNEAKKDYIPILRANNISKEIIFDDLVYVSKKNISKEQLIQEHDVLISMSSGSKHLVGKVAISRMKLEMSYGAFCALIRIDNGLEKKFIFNYLRSNAFKKYITEISSGTNINNLKREHVLNSILPLPPLAEQQRIVTKIEEMFSSVDQGIEKLKKVRGQIKMYRQSVLKAAFEGRLVNGSVYKDLEVLKTSKSESKTSEGSKKSIAPLTEEEISELPILPKGWRRVKLGEVFSIHTGITPDKQEDSYYGKDYPFYKPTDLNAGTNVILSSDGLTEKGIKYARLIPKDSTLVTCIGATIGKAGLIRRAGACNQQINAIIADDKIAIPEFVYYQIISHDFQIKIKENASSTTLPILNKSKFSSLEFALPSLSVQNAIVDAIESRLSKADLLDKAVEDALQKAEQTKQSILKKAFRGELV